MSARQPSQQLVQMIIGSWVSRAIYLAAKLQIADLLADGPRSAEDLADTAGVAPRPLYRVLRALAGVGVFSREADGRFGLNPLAEPLREAGPKSLRALAVMVGEEQNRCWDDLFETVRTGEPAFDRLYGRPLFAYLGEHPEHGEIFDAAMTGFSSRAMRAMLDAYDLSGVVTLADVGGGLGTNLTAALARYPKLRGLLFDQPHVVERARPRLEAAGVAGRCTVEGGDFFKTAPRGADAYMLGHIIHDWDDVKAGLILDNLRRAMPAGAKLLLVEHVLPEGDGASFGKLLDLHMMVLLGGLERTEAEYRQLFAAHGFLLTRVVPTTGDVAVVEGVRLRARNTRQEQGCQFTEQSTRSLWQPTNATNEEYVLSDFSLLINGRLVEGAGTLDVVNPATAGILTTAPRADRAQLDEAVAAAKAAFPTWSARPLGERGALLIKLAQALQSEQGEFARLLTQEQGKPLPHALGEIAFSIAALGYFATLDLRPEVLKEDATQKVVRQLRPFGVIAAITPWNLPLLLLTIKVAPALLAGNTVVAKPAPTTPLTTLKFGELCARILPAGVVNIIVDQNDLGSALTGHPDVAKVAFTGSTATGKKVMESAAGTLKRLTMELGGNDAAIVLDDVDPKEVAPKIYAGAMFNAGQACIAIKRLYVHDSIYDAVCDELEKLARETVVGDGLEQGTQMGPIQNKAQFEKVKGFLEDARRNGNIVAGGRALDSKGYFVQPTIVRDICDDARLVREEQFGPVLPVLRYSDIDDVIARANDTDFGLGGSVWSSDRDRAFEVAARINSGTVWVNKHLDVGLDTPFAGAKQSGIGAEMGQEGLEEFTQATIINMAK